VESGLEDYQATGAKIIMPHFCGLLAQAHLHAGDASRGLTIMQTALEDIERSNERWSEVELYRVQAELLRAAPGVTDRQDRIERSLRQAIGVARAQDARWLELRAVADLMQSITSDEVGSVSAGLDAIVSSFTEGFDTDVLKTARRLLASFR